MRKENLGTRLTLARNWGRSKEGSTGNYGRRKVDCMLCCKSSTPCNNEKQWREPEMFDNIGILWLFWSGEMERQVPGSKNPSVDILGKEVYLKFSRNPMERVGWSLLGNLLTSLVSERWREWLKMLGQLSSCMKGCPWGDAGKMI